VLRGLPVAVRANDLLRPLDREIVRARVGGEQRRKQPGIVRLVLDEGLEAPTDLPSLDGQREPARALVMPLLLLLDLDEPLAEVPLARPRKPAYLQTEQDERLPQRLGSQKVQAPDGVRQLLLLRYDQGGDVRPKPLEGRTLLLQEADLPQATRRVHGCAAGDGRQRRTSGDGRARRDAHCEAERAPLDRNPGIAGHLQPRADPFEAERTTRVRGSRCEPGQRPLHRAVR
jgi:hypothetical protein